MLTGVACNIATTYIQCHRVCFPATSDHPEAVADSTQFLQPDFLLIDGMKGGSGEAIDWKALQVPVHEATQGWLLAGGLSPDNVAKAAAIAGPTGVDVSSGVALPDGSHLLFSDSAAYRSV